MSTLQVGPLRGKLYRVGRQFEIRFKHGGQWHRVKGAPKAHVLRRAEIQAIFATNQDNARFQITDEVAYEAKRAAELGHPYGFGILDTMRERIARAQQKPAVGTLTVAETVGQFIASRAGRSEYYLRDLKVQLGRFVAVYQGPIGTVAEGDVRAWLDSLKVSPRTWNNHRNAVAALLKFAGRPEVCQGLRPHDIDATDEPVIYTPAQMRRYLDAASPHLSRCLALSAFAHLRSEEVWRLGRVGKWSIDFEHGKILLGRKLVKGRRGKKRPRQVPMTDNLRAWLADWKPEDGPICPYKNAKVLSGMKVALGQRIGLPWSRNALRKSSISYRLALLKDLAEVALEAGNSPKVIQDSYLDLASEQAAAEWYRLYPVSKNREFFFANDPQIRHLSVTPKILTPEFSRKMG